MSGEASDWLTNSTLLRDLHDYRNQPAWDGFVSRFRRPIVRFAASMGLRHDDAEDVAQDTLVEFGRLYREGRYESGRGRLSKWLFGIAYKKVLRSRERAARRRREVAPDDSQLLNRAIDEKNVHHTWNTEWERDVYARCLARVRTEVEPATMRAFELVVGGSLSAAEAASRIGVPVKAVYNAKHRVLKRIRELRVELEDV